MDRANASTHTWNIDSTTVITVTCTHVGMLWALVYLARNASMVFTAAGAVLFVLLQATCAWLLVRRCQRLRTSLRRVVRELREVRQSERERTARDLHDGVGQMLIAAQHSLALAAEQRLVPAESEAYFSRGLQQLRDAIGEVRCVSHDLKSVLLRGADLSAALRKVCRDFGACARMEVDCRLPDASLERGLSAAAKCALLRIVQEALSNAHKHAGASRVEVTIETCARHVQLRVLDNGRGLSTPTSGATMPEGIGIENMRERAAAVGGSLVIRSVGAHTEVCARVPYQSQLH